MRLSYWALAGLVAVAIGCNSGGKGPATPAPIGQMDLETTALPGGDAMPGLAGNAFLGGYTFQVNADTASATVEGWRLGAETDDQYHLSVQTFFHPGDLVITGVTQGATTLDIDYQTKHPFAGASDLQGNATAANREDLGLAARMLVLVDLPPAAVTSDYTYFGGEAVVNTRVIANADGYYQPKGLLTNTGSLTANTFPYKLVVDEAAGAEGNRVGIGHGGNVTGNYRPLEGGWQAGTLEFNGTNNGWTGYDILHQGQTTTNTLRVNLAAIGGGSFSFNTAMIAKYTDPRGGLSGIEKRANRLPRTPYNVLKFVYRMPYGALDVSVVRSLGEDGTLVANNTSSLTTMRFHVRDWDKNAAVSARANLADEADPAMVPAGTTGAPTVSVDIPGVTTAPVLLTENPIDTGYGGDPGPDSGIAGDPMFFEGTILNAGGVGGQVNGPVYGLVKVVDIENALNRSAYEFSLNPSLVVLTSNQPGLVTYQAADVVIGGAGGNTPPTATVAIAGGPVPLVNPGSLMTFQVVSEFDVENNPVLYDIDVTNDASFEATGLDPVGTPPPSVFLYTASAPPNPGASNAPHQARVNYYDAASAGSPSTLLIDYVVAPAGANLPPTATVTLAAVSIASGGTLTFNLTAENDPNGDTVQYAIDYDFTGVFTPNVSNLDPGAPPTVLHTSSVQTNPSGIPENRTARVQYSDGIAPAINIDLPYTIGPGSCATTSMSWDFNSGAQGWSEGQQFAYGILMKNSDSLGWGHLRHNGGVGACAPTTAESAGISGGYWLSGDDGDNTSCTYLCDYGTSADFSMVSPWINVPPICVPGSLQLSFNAFMNAAPGAVATLTASGDYGDTWVNLFWTQTANGTSQSFGNVTVPLFDSYGDRPILLRFRFKDAVSTSTWRFNSSSTCSSSGDTPVGLTIDNVVISVGSSGTFTTDTPTSFPCREKSVVMTFPYISHGWIGGQGAPVALPNTDGTGFWGSFRYTDCDSSESGGTYAAVELASNFEINDASLNCTNDGTTSSCGSFLDDYGSVPNYNVVSPQILIPANCPGPQNVLLKFNAYLNVDDSNGTDPGGDGWDSTVHVRAYLSGDNGVTWSGNVPFWSQAATQAGQLWVNQTFDITPYAGTPQGIRIRFQFQGSSPNNQDDVDGDPFGFYVDNIRVESSSTNTFYILQ